MSRTTEAKGQWEQCPVGIAASVAALAFLLDRAMEKKLGESGSTPSSPFAWRALETIRCVKLEPDGQSKLLVTRGSRHASQVLKALGITKLDPPEPLKEQPTVMQ